jgi:tRNA A-37 threonylcarbamoyl transferase component Bud32
MTATAGITSWARQVMSAPDAAAETIVETPWSRVLKMTASGKNYYLKQPARGLFIEAEIISACRSLCGITAIPELIAQDDALHCFLMTDCGDKALRTVFDGKLDAALMAQGIRAYAGFQRATAPHVDAFLALGAPDWRLDLMPRLYDALVRDDEFMAAQQLDDAQIKSARDYSVTVATSCAVLAAYNIPECLTHSDIHDNNMILGADGRISIIDLGETAIDHPFLSLAWLLRRTGFRYPLPQDSADYKILFDACFDDWGISGADVRQAFHHANILLPCYGILSHLRLMQSAGDAIDDVRRMKGRLRELFMLVTH